MDDANDLSKKPAPLHKQQPSAAVQAAVDEYLRLGEPQSQEWKTLSEAELGSPVEHNDLIKISQSLVREARRNDRSTKEWRLDTLLKGTVVYQAPPPLKPEPSAEFKALMHRLRQQEEQRQYERMLNPPSQQELFQQRYPNATPSFGETQADAIDEVTYEDVKRQMILIINVLVSIICCSVAIWVAARRWSVPQRLGLSFSGSTLVAVAEVAIYMGYLRRIKDAKVLEGKKIERREVVDTWVIDGKSTSARIEASDGARFRKGKHR